jgi:sigma-B regulation protein RsbU (phosphoserine phosphatase)
MRQHAKVASPAFIRRPLEMSFSTAAWSTSGPAKSGGDSAEAFTVTEESIAVGVWDASGHGEAVAGNAILVRSGFHALLDAGLDIVPAISGLNHVLFGKVDKTRPWQFVSGFFGLVNTAAHTLRYVSCGHDTAILFRGANDHLHLTSRSPLLGVSRLAEFTLETVRIDRGDGLIIVTDGITDARPLRSPAQFFGSRRLCSVESSSRTKAALHAQQIIDLVLEYSDGYLDDDAAALVARFT